MTANATKSRASGADLRVQTVLDEALDVLQDLSGQQHNRRRSVADLWTNHRRARRRYYSTNGIVAIPLIVLLRENGFIGRIEFDVYFRIYEKRG